MHPEDILILGSHFDLTKRNFFLEACTVIVIPKTEVFSGIMLFYMRILKPALWS